MKVNDNLGAELQRMEYQSIVERVAALHVAGDGEVLDWGCGQGQILAGLIGKQLPAIGIDYDPEAYAVEEIELQMYPGLSAQRTNDPVNLPFEDQRFSVVLSCGVLEHVQDPLRSLRELRRVLKPGGTLLIYKLPNKYSALEFIAKAAGLPYHGMRVHDTLWGVRSTRWALEASGFEEIEVERSNMIPLTVSGRLINNYSGHLWKANKFLDRIRGLNLLATNVDAVAVKPLEIRRREVNS